MYIGSIDEKSPFVNTSVFGFDETLVQLRAFRQIILQKLRPVSQQVLQEKTTIERTKNIYALRCTH